MEVVSISLGRGILEKGSREYVRMHQYAERLGAFHIIVLTRKTHGYITPVHEGTLTVYPTNSANRLMMLWDAFWIARDVLKRTQKRDVVVSAQDPLEMGWLSALLTWRSSARLHVQVHGDYFGDGWCGRSPVRWVKRVFAHVLLRRAPAVRVVSERIKYSLVTRGISGAKISVLPIRPELEVFLAQTAEVRTEPPYTFIFVGRLAPEKDIARIIKAFVEVHMAVPGVRLRIVGSGECEQALRAITRTFGVEEVVTFVPWTGDVAREMASADVFVLASKHEAYGLVLLEAMAVGLPIVTTNVGCVGEVVRDDVHGVVVYEETTHAYAEAMQKLITDVSLRTRMAREGKASAVRIATTSQDAYAEAWVNTLLPPRD